jgi:hypothetical protein
MLPAHHGKRRQPTSRTRPSTSSSEKALPFHAGAQETTDHTSRPVLLVDPVASAQRRVLGVR